MPNFTLTEDHIKLLRRAAIEWDGDDAYQGHFAQHSKRPYGNSGVLGDVRDILDRDLTDEESQNIHEETATALEVVLTAGEFRPGTYVCDWPRRNWRLVAEDAPSGEDLPHELAMRLRAWTDSEFTEYPLWAIGEMHEGIGFVWVCGPWFDRESAEAFLKAKRYRYGKDAIVYCLSGGQSSNYQDVQEIAKRILAQKKEVGIA